MGCNCGDNEYNITVDNNGNCEPTTPIYNITLANVGVNGYSPIVKFVNETIDSFNIAVDNVTGTETSPAVPKLSYVSDQINNINTTIANLGDTYLTVNGSNANNPITINGIKLRDTGYGVRIENTYDGFISMSSSGTIIGTNGYLTLGNGTASRIMLSPAQNGKVYYGSTTATANEVAVKGDIPSVPTVGNGTITLTQGGVPKGTFTTNQSGNTTIELDAGGGSITNPLIVQNSNSDGYAEVYGQGAYASDTSSGGVFATQWTETVDDVEHTYTRKLSLSNGGRYGTKPYIQYEYKDEVGGSGTSSISDLGFLNVSGVTFAPLSIGSFGGGYKYILNYNTDTLGLDTDSKLTVKEMVGCDSITGGAAGLVPAPSAGDQDKFLKGDGTWDTVGGGGSSYTAGTGIDITNNTISVDESVVMTTGNQSTINFGAKQFSHITIANGYSTGEGLYGWLDDGSSTIPLVRVSDLDDVIIGDRGSKLVLHGNETRPSYFNGQTTSYLALYNDIPDVSQLQEKLTAGDGITIEKTLDGAMTPDWYLNDVALDPVPSTIATPAVGVTNTYKPYNNQTFSNTADEINIVWDVLYANTSSATGGFIKATGSDGAITLSFDGGYQGASSYFNVKCNINSSDVVNETLYIPYQDATYIRGAFTFNNTTKVWSITFTNTTTNTVIASQTGTTSVNIIPTNSLITIQMLNANGSQNGITIKTDTFTVSASNTEITQISVDNTVVALQSDLPTNYLTTNTSQTISTGTKTMASGTSQVFVSGSSLDIRGNNTLFLRGASQAQGGYLGLSGRSRDTVNNVAINVIRLQANTTGDLANLRLQGYDLYSNPYLYNGFTRLGQVSVSSGDINITTESGVELQYNGNKVATVNDIPDISTKQDTLVSGTNIKTINNQSILGSGNITIQGGGTVDQTFDATSANAQSGVAIAGAGFLTGITSGDVTTALGYTPYNSSNPSGYQANKIETIKVNGTAQTITSKTVDITVPINNNQLTNGAGYITTSALNGYAKTADLATVATSGSYNDLTNKPKIPAAQVQADWNVTNTSSMAYIKNKPSIPSAVTESTVSGWGFTKNIGTVTSVNNVSPVNGNVTLSIPSTNNLANKDLSNLSTTGQAVIDGQWVKKSATLATNVTWKQNTAAKTYSLSSYLPNDDYNYEVLFSGVAITGATSGNFVTIQLSTTFVDDVSVCEARTRTASTMESQGNAILPIGSNRAVTQYSSSSANANGTYSLYVRAYRRIGKNS